MLGDPWRFPIWWTSGQSSTGSLSCGLSVMLTTATVSSLTSTVFRFISFFSFDSSLCSGRLVLLNDSVHHGVLIVYCCGLITDRLWVQMQQRRTLAKLPLQANFYPMTSASFLQDSSSRLSLLSAQSQGVGALSPGGRSLLQDPLNNALIILK